MIKPPRKPSRGSIREEPSRGPRPERPIHGPRPEKPDRPKPPRPHEEEWQSRPPRKRRPEEGRPAPSRPAGSNRPTGPKGPKSPISQYRRPVPKPDFRREIRRPEAPREDVKEIWKPGTMLYPVPAVLVTSLGRDGKPNVCTVAWTGTVCSEPPMLSISLRESRLSHENIMQSRQFVVNMPSEALIRKTDYCGIVSGRDVDKFAETGMTIALASQVQAPIIVECPVNIECAVRKTLELGSHTLFLAEILAVQVNKDLITPSGRFAIEKAGLIAYVHGGYYPIGEKLGKFGYSVRKKK